MVEIGPGPRHARRAGRGGRLGLHRDRGQPDPDRRAAREGAEGRQGVDAAHPGADGSADVVYADQVLEHMSGIDAARQFTAEALRALRPGGVFFVVVPDYLKERTFFWDVDYTHNFVTTERRVKQLFNDSGFESCMSCAASAWPPALRRDALAAAALLVNIPGVDALSRWTGHRGLLFKVRKNLFETLTFVARKPQRGLRRMEPALASSCSATRLARRSVAGRGSRSTAAILSWLVDPDRHGRGGARRARGRACRICWSCWRWSPLDRVVMIWRWVLLLRASGVADRARARPRASSWSARSSAASCPPASAPTRRAPTACRRSHSRRRRGAGLGGRRPAARRAVAGG